MQKLNKQERTESYHGYNFPAPEYQVGFINHKSGKYVIEINAPIEDVAQFSTAIQILSHAEEDDEIEIHLQTPGGDVDATGAFLHALRKCSAPIHIIASGGVHSCGTHILLEADSFELAENFNSLIHNGSAGAGGNINEYHAKSDFDKAFIRKLYAGIYEGFLTNEEFNDMMRGDNIWLDAAQWHDRAVARMDYFKAKYEKFEEDQAQAVAAEIAKREAEDNVVVKTPKRKPLKLSTKEVAPKAPPVV